MKNDWNVDGVDFMKRYLPKTYVKFLKDYYPESYERYLEEHEEIEKFGLSDVDHQRLNRS